MGRTMRGLARAVVLVKEESVRGCNPRRWQTCDSRSAWG